jgi:hypothetical protein
VYIRAIIFADLDTVNGTSQAITAKIGGSTVSVQFLYWSDSRNAGSRIFFFLVEHLGMHYDEKGNI